MDKVTITIIGAGVIGLAVGRECAQSVADVLIIEKNSSFGQETSSRNSEVIHAGIYYPAGTLKHTTCIEGKDLLYEFCRAHAVPHKKSENSLSRLITLKRRIWRNSTGAVWQME
jgi:L-2-hydroxyglutarate oxidase LhgO